jgi:hypothetical protein
VTPALLEELDVVPAKLEDLACVVGAAAWAAKEALDAGSR